MPHWWTMRPARNRKPVTYRCPLCGGQLPALMDHVLIAPEGDASKRRHAHSECVAQARRAGRLPTRDEYERAAGLRPPTLRERLRTRLAGRGR